jgi:hypothetical protein
MDQIARAPCPARKSSIRMLANTLKELCCWVDDEYRRLEARIPEVMEQTPKPPKTPAYEHLLGLPICTLTFTIDGIDRVCASQDEIIRHHTPEWNDTFMLHTRANQLSVFISLIVRLNRDSEEVREALNTLTEEAYARRMRTLAAYQDNRNYSEEEEDEEDDL